MATFERDDSLVAAAASTGNTPIESSGAYVGVFTQAKHRLAKTGAKGIEFNFEAVDGATARYLTLWVERANGERMAYGYGLLSGLMVCLDLKSIDSANVVSDEWDSGVGARVPTKIEVYPDLVNRQIGVLLQREEQEWDGKLRVSMRIVDFFNPVTRQMPAEILGGAGATGQLDRMAEGLKDRIIRAAPPSAGGMAPGAGGTTAGASAAPAARQTFADFSEDDIPF